MTTRAVLGRALTFEQKLFRAVVTFCYFLLNVLII